jgi:hypothetical protein
VRLRAAVMLAAVMALFSPSTAHAQFWGGCVDAAGRPVRDYPNDMLNDIAVSRVDGAGNPVIEYNSRIVLSVGPVTRRFFYLHECGHHALGQIITGAYFPLVSEQQADCWAARAMTSQGYTLADLRQVQADIAQSPGDWSHLPGPQRALNVPACLDSAGQACRQVTNYETRIVNVPTVVQQRTPCQHCGCGPFGCGCAHPFDVVPATVIVPQTQQVPITRTVCQ